jgi:predicted DNA-binding transcriptional regulator AlpA
MASPDTDLDRVNSFEEFCSRAGISPATGRRLLDAGEGPTVTWLSARRMGIRERHYREWLDRRTKKKAAAA